MSRLKTSGRPDQMDGTDDQEDAALRASELRFRQLAVSLAEERAALETAQRVAKVGSWETDFVTLAVHWSDEIFRIFGLDAATFRPTHLTFLEHVHPADQEEVDAAFRESFGTRDLCSVTHRIVLADGSIKHLEERWRTFVDDAGVPSRAVGTSQDITERRVAEIAIERSENLLHVASAIGRIGAFRVEIPAGTRFWSEELSAIFDLPRGYTPPLDEALSYYAPADRERMLSRFARCRDEGIGYDEELSAVTQAGRKIWVRTIGQPMRDAHGQLVGMQGALQDITEARNAREAIRASEERFRILATATNDASYDWDMLTDSITWNDGIEQVFGFSQAEVGPISASWNPRVHDLDRDRVLTQLHDAIVAGDSFWSGEYRFERKDGRYAYVLDRGYILRAADGTPQRMIGGLTDLTTRKEAELRLAQQATLLDAAHDAILVMDLSDRITYWNKGAERTFGWSAEDAIGHPAAALFQVDPVRYREAHDALLEHGQWEGELTKCGRDGAARTVDVRWTLVNDEQDRPAAVFAIDSDVTERKRLEAQFFRAQRLESLGTLAGGIAHDLNNVLTPILVSIELLRMEESDPLKLESLNTIETSALRGAEMVKQVLGFARGADGKRLMVDLRRIARDVEAIVHETFPKDISFHLGIDPSLWVVIGDETQIHQVVMNLCVNARDAMPQGGALTMHFGNTVLDEIYAGMNPEARPGPYVRISVADTGHGIPPAVMERIFEPFFTTKDLHKGTGLGLSTVHSIVKAHKGSVNVHSEPGKGARFTVHFPAIAGAADDEPVAAVPAGLPRGSGEQILIVDDEDAIRTIVRRTLERFGYRVMEAANGAEAVALYSQHRADIAAVLTDMAMPVMDGPSMIIALKAMDPAVRVIGSSGFSTNENVIRAIGAGVGHFVPKPYTAETLLTTLRDVLDA